MSWARSCFKCLVLAAVPLVGISHAQLGFDFGSNKDGRIGLIDFAGPAENFVSWGASEEARKAFKTVECIYIRDACSAELSSCFRKCPNLEKLWLGVSPDGATFEPGSIAALNGVSSLRDLQIYGTNQKSGEFARVNNLDDLRILGIDGGVKIDISDLTSIGSFCELRELRIRCDRIDHCKWLSGLTLLDDLTLNAESVNLDPGFFEALPKLTELKRLTIRGVSFNEAETARLGALLGNQLEYLHFQLQSDAIAGLSLFTNLRRLEISTDEFGEFRFQFLSKTPKLAALHAKGWEITGSHDFTEYPALKEVHVTDGKDNVKLHWER